MTTDTADCEFLTAAEAAKRLRISLRTMREMLIAGQIEAFTVGSRWRIPRANLDRWVEEQTAKRR